MLKINQLSDLELEAILESITDGVLILTKLSEIVFANKSALTILGLATSLIEGKKIDQIISGIDSASFNLDTNSLVPEQLSKQNLNITLNSKVIVADLVIRPLESSDYLLVIIRDISEQQSHEQTKDNFLSIAAHQLRTPLGSSRWNLEMILGGDFGEVSPQIKSILEQVYETNQRMVTLVNDLLDVSRIDQKRVKDNPIETNLIKIIQETIVELNPQIRTRAIKLELQVPSDLPSVVLDPERFKEVFENLLSNALKYNKQNGQVGIKVTLEGENINFEISDSGRGIPQTDQRNIFSKFFRATNAALSETEGSGLGLFVVRSYIESWGGKIWFKSLKDQGTTFYFTIPVKAKQHTLDDNLANLPIS